MSAMRPGHILSPEGILPAPIHPDVLGLVGQWAQFLGRS